MLAPCNLETLSLARPACGAIRALTEALVIGEPGGPGGLGQNAFTGRCISSMPSNRAFHRAHPALGVAYRYLVGTGRLPDQLRLSTLLSRAQEERRLLAERPLEEFERD